MKWCRSGLWVVGLVLMADVSEWARRLDAGSAAQGAFFKQVALPSGPVMVRRGAVETKGELTKLIQANAADAELLRLRARESEGALDFAGAEADWKAYAERAQGWGELAEFYGRRGKAREEVAALRRAAAVRGEGLEALRPAEKQASWGWWDRAIRVAEEQGLPVEDRLALYRDRAAQYAGEALAYESWIEAALRAKRVGEAEAALAAGKVLAEGAALRWRGAIEVAKGNGAGALEAFERSYDPVWPEATVEAYLSLVEERGGLRRFREAAAGERVRNPGSWAAATKLFHYWHRAKDETQAALSVERWRQAKEKAREAFAPLELMQAAELLGRAGRHEEAARYWQGAYALGDAAAQERALAEVIRMLVEYPQEPIALGSGDLSFYREAATADLGPGFLNGALSLLLNGQGIGRKFEEQEAQASGYWRRGEAGRLLELFRARFPRSGRRAELEAGLIRALAVHGEADAVIRRGEAWLAENRAEAGDRRAVAMAVADAYARKGRTVEEFGVYERLLGELAKASGGVPVGEEGMWRQEGERARSGEYARVLERYLSRLVAMQRLPEAFAVYRKQLDANPGDPGLYERLAEFLQQNRRVDEVEAVYQQARGRFPGRTWTEKLARWYLGRKQEAKLAQLTSEVTKAFSGTELEEYFQAVVNQGNVGAQFYLQTNLAAARRFPRNPVFVRNVVAAYRGKNEVERMRWLRESWHLDAGLRDEYFAALSAKGQLEVELRAARGLWKPGSAAGNPALARLVAEGEIWRGHFEEAGGALAEVAGLAPGDASEVDRAVDLARSLGDRDRAVALLQGLAEADRSRTAALTKWGEIEAEGGRMGAAKAAWDRIAGTKPGSGEVYLEAATVFWDYYEMGEAKRWLEEGRRRTGSRFGYEMGALLEGEGKLAEAVAEYASAGDEESEARLKRLAGRAGTAALVEAGTRGAGLPLRMSVLRVMGGKARAEVELLARVRTTEDPAVLAYALENGYERASEAALARRVEIATDPVERLRWRVEQARDWESRGEKAKAGSAMDSVLRENPRVLGVVRAAADFYWGRKEAARAVEVLDQAARVSYPELRKELWWEAAGKAREAKLWRQAKGLVEELGKVEDGSVRWVELKAEVWMGAGEGGALGAFFEEEMKRGEGLRKRELYAGVLAKLGRNPEAVEQYAEVIRRDPGDMERVQKALALEERAGVAVLRERLGRAAAESPRDGRYWAVLARIERWYGGMEAAAEALRKAVEIRPEEQGWRSERASVLERLGRWDEAKAEYGKLVELSYGSREWLVAQARVAMRAGRPEEAARVLDKGTSVRDWLDAARRLNEWGAPQEALRFAERALAAGGEDEGQGAAYAEAMVRLRRAGEGWDALVKRAGEGSVGGAVSEFGLTVAKYYTPEEKAAFAAEIEARWKTATGVGDLVELARWCGFRDLEAKLLADLVAEGKAGVDGSEWMPRLRALQRGRLRYSELGAALERRAAKLTGEGKVEALRQAAGVYREAGNGAGEARVRAQLPGDSRYFEVLGVDRLVALAKAAGPVDRRRAAVDELVRRGAEVAKVTEALGAVSKSAWDRAAIGLYLGDASAGAAFAAVVGRMEIGERLREVQGEEVAGARWYAAADAYGRWWKATGGSEVAEWQGAALEAGPVSSARLAGWARRWKDADPAVAASGYERALALGPDRELEGELAAAEWAAGRREAALGRWRGLLAEVKGEADRRRWVRLADAIFGAKAGLGSELEAAAERAYGSGAALPSFDAEMVARALPGRFGELIRWVTRDGSTVAGLLEEHWLSAEQREMALKALGREGGERYGQWLLDQGRAAEALALLPESGAKRLIALGMNGTLRVEDLEKVSEEELLEAAGELKRRGKREAWLGAAGAAYRRGLDRGRLEAGSVLGWAEVLLERGDRAGALVWLRRLTGMVGEAFDHEETAARLLDRFGMGEAKEFRAALGKGAGWRMATGPEADYAKRVAAARGSGRSGWGSAELDLLAKPGPVAVADADKPYYRAAMEAVASEDLAVAVQRLTYLLGERPEDEELRLAVFRAAVKAGRWRLADLALIQIRREHLTGEDWLAAGEAAERLAEWGEAASAAAEARRRLEGPARARALELLDRVQARQERDEQSEMRRPRVGELPGDRGELARRAE